MPKIRLVVDEENVGIRIDAYCSTNTELSRNNIQKLIETNKLLVNGLSTINKYKTKFNDVIDIEFEEKVLTNIKPQNIPLDIIYEDSELIVINKQKGLVVHPAVGNYDNTLVNALLYHCKELSDVNGYYRPGIVHRIDKDTSGLLVCCKSNYAHQEIAKQLQDKTCFRKYLAIVDGIIQNNEGIINAPIGRSEKDRQKMTVTDKNAKEAITEFKVLKRLSDSTFIECNLKTGRTHQIRVHLKFIGHPVLNDNKYSRRLIDVTGQYLHAYYLSFIHPMTKERMEFKTPIPKYMEDFIKQNEPRNE